MMVKGEERFVSCAKLEFPHCVFISFDINDNLILYYTVLLQCV